VPADAVRPQAEPLAELVDVERAVLVEQPQQPHTRLVAARPVSERLEVVA
jgi:hypothetical protein